jgi:hypothetical protein
MSRLFTVMPGPGELAGHSQAEGAIADRRRGSIAAVTPDQKRLAEALAVECWQAIAAMLEPLLMARSLS